MNEENSKIRVKANDGLNINQISERIRSLSQFSSNAISKKSINQKSDFSEKRGLNTNQLSKTIISIDVKNTNDGTYSGK